MKLSLILILFILTSCGSTKNETKEKDTKSKNPGVLTLEGSYQGKNLYIQNPASDKNGFCTTKVIINDSIALDDSIINSSAFEINLEKLDFKHGDPVKIEIHHDPNCSPKVLNPEVN
jgi:hypothetical protein